MEARFLPGAATKDALRLEKPDQGLDDPFGPTIRALEQLTVREGVESVTNGRGGRTTSGTCAPHYSADFLPRSTPSREELQHARRLAIAMDVQETRMLHYDSPSPPPTPKTPTYWRNSAWERDIMKSPSKSPKRKPKDVPTTPFRVLDAPALRDDYYCSLLAYSHTAQCLAVGLGPHVYLWSEAKGTAPAHIPDSLTAPFGAHVSSVSFSSTEGECAILAIGRADGRVTLWSPQDRDPRFDCDQPAPVSCISFRPTTTKRPSVRDPIRIVSVEELLVGDEVGNVYYYSVEWPSPDERDLFDWHGSMTLLARISCHTQQVCGIAWSPDGAWFASGGNDNQLFLYQTKRLFPKSKHNDSPSSANSVNVRNGNSGEDETLAGQGTFESSRGGVSVNLTDAIGRVLSINPGREKHIFTLNAAVKAIAFAPWQPTLVAAGGGSNDRCIHFFHALSGARLATIDCHAQVTSLVWSEKRKEIAATFGFAQPEHPYRVAVFSWPSCRRVVAIPWWSEERALYAVAYPGGPSTSGASPSSSPRERRLREEGCLVVATSDASIKFHEIWPERREKASPYGSGGDRGVLGGSLILEDTVSEEMERASAIR